MKWILLQIFLTMSMTGYSQNPKHSDTIELNGLHTYFEVYGDGDPLLLLHGFRSLLNIVMNMKFIWLT